MTVSRTKHDRLLKNLLVETECHEDGFFGSARRDDHTHLDYACL